MKCCDDDDDMEQVEYVRKDWEVSVIEDAAEFCMTGSFRTSIDEFIDEHLHIFETSESKSLGKDEYLCEYMEVFNDYQLLVENLLLSFLKSKGSSLKSFYAECRDAIDGKYTVLFEDHEHKWFVDMLLSWLEYSHFFEMMKKKTRRSHK